MEYQSEFTLPLWDSTPPLWNLRDTCPESTLNLALKDDSVPRPLILLFPSGGYHHLDTEPLHPIAAGILELDCHVGIVNYRTSQDPSLGPLGHGPLMDAQKAFRLIRGYASKWNVLPESIIALGFGAGAHLAAASAIHSGWHAPEIDESGLEIHGGPNAMALGHGFISNHVSHYHYPLERILGTAPDSSLQAFYTLEKRITPAVPRSFLWHTLEDPQNPATDSLRLAEALAANKVDCELHIFNKGGHAMDWNDDASGVSQWKSLFLSWLGRTLPKLNNSASPKLNPKVL